MNPEHLLKTHGLRKTAGRVAVLQSLAHEAKALSHGELQQKLQNEVDRVTLYRILEIMEEKGILHKIPDDEVSVKYALCEHDHDVAHQHSDNHAHFKCTSCGDTLCLEEAEIPSVKTPQGFLIESKFLLLNGTCANCVE